MGVQAELRVSLFQSMTEIFAFRVAMLAEYVSVRLLLWLVVLKFRTTVKYSSEHVSQVHRDPL